MLCHCRSAPDPGLVPLTVLRPQVDLTAAAQADLLVWISSGLHESPSFPPWLERCLTTTPHTCTYMPTHTSHTCTYMLTHTPSLCQGQHPAFWLQRKPLDNLSSVTLGCCIPLMWMTSYRRQKQFPTTASHSSFDVTTWHFTLGRRWYSCTHAFLSTCDIRKS